MAEIREEDRQAAETLLEWFRGAVVHDGTTAARKEFISRAAQLRADAFTAGQVVGVERAAEVCDIRRERAIQTARDEKVDRAFHVLTRLQRDLSCRLDGRRNEAEDNAISIRKLSPDPDYIERAIRLVRDRVTELENDGISEANWHRLSSLPDDLAAALRSQVEVEGEDKNQDQG